MSLCQVIGTVVDPSGTLMAAVPVSFTTQTQATSVEPYSISTQTSVNGQFRLSITQGLSGVITMKIPISSTSNQIVYRFNVNIPSSSSAQFSSILVDN